jgi:N-methylhydantoinase A
MVDMHTIGAGGGSIASVDAGGLLQVGPASAGADPGPACYDRGGTQATVTDANLVLGRLQAGAFLGGGMTLDLAAARDALAPIADALQCSIEQAARGVIRVANEHMARALRVMSIQRGHDPREFTLMSFGGAGGLHVCALAEALNMPQAIVPAHGGVLSAFGMLAAPRTRELTRTVSAPLQALAPSEIEAALDALEDEGREALQTEGVAAAAIRVQRAVDLCYRGQAYTFTVAWRDPAASEAAFQALHEQRYGHRLELPVELVNVRVSLRGPHGNIALVPPVASRDAAAVSEVVVHDEDRPVPVYAREQLAIGQRLVGPALITETVSTTWLAAGWQAEVHDSGSVLLTRAGP